MTRKRHSRLWRLAVLTAGVVLAAGWFIWLRPTALGGRQSYVVVRGPSMEPTYHDGDLVIIREEEQYAKGDIIAFHAGGRFDDPTRIIHRIVDFRPDGVIVTKGDNRAGLDPWEPTQDDVIGRAVFHVADVGGWAVRAGQPEVLAALGGAAVVAGGSTRRRRRRLVTLEPPDEGAPTPADTGPRLQRTSPTPPRWLRHTEPRWAFAGLAAAVVLALPVLLLSWSTIRAADTTSKQVRIGALDFGINLDYRFTGQPSAVYPTGIVGTSKDGSGLRTPTDPLYSRLLANVDVSMAFHAAAENVDDLTSAYSVDVAVAMAQGWTSPIEHIDATPFETDASRVVTVDLRDVASKVAQFTELTGVGGEEYTITLTPRLEVEGTTGALPVRDDVAPSISFVVNGSVIDAQPIADATGSRDLVREVRRAARYDLGPVSVSIDSARGLLGGLVLVLLAAGAYCASVLFAGVGLGESDRIAARYRSQLVDVSSATGPPGPVVMVGGIDELARLAKVEQSVILHEDLGDGCHRYRVFLGAVTYEYETAPEHAGNAVDAAPEPATPADAPAAAAPQPDIDPERPSG